MGNCEKCKELEARLETAIAIMRDKALLQVKPGTADEHGYTLLRSDRRDDGQWRVRLRTPHSTALAAKEVDLVVYDDLKRFYGLVEGVTGRLELGRRRGIWRVEAYSADYGRGVWEVTVLSTDPMTPGE